MPATILIVEDEARLAEILEDYLRREGFHTEKSQRWQASFRTVASSQSRYDLCLILCYQLLMV